MTRPAPDSLLLVVAVVVLMVFAATSCIAPIVPDAKDSADEQQDPNLEEATSTPTPTDTPTPEPEAEAMASASPTPVPCLIINVDGTITDCASAPTPYNADDRDIACVPIFPFDGSEAYKAVSNSGSNMQIGWSFGVTFSRPSDDPNDAPDPRRRPLACFHIYQRDDSIQEFVPIDHGGVLVDSCTVSAQGVMIDYGLQQASFCTDGRVVCETDIGVWLTSSEVKAYAALDNANSDSLTVADLLNGMLHEGLDAPYPHLALVAHAWWSENSPTCGDPEAEPPIVQPLVRTAPATGPGAIHELNVLMLNPEAARLTYEPNNCSPLPTWGPGEQDMRIWYDLMATTNGPQLSFLAEGVPLCEAQSSPSEILYWIGEGVVTIGARDGESLGATVKGILVDPTDSVPPQ
mgnify:CR=1 FL=1